MSTVPASGRYPFTNHRTVAELDAAAAVKVEREREYARYERAERVAA